MKAVEYMETCAKLGIVPLRHDANVFREKLNSVKNSKELK